MNLRILLACFIATPLLGQNERPDSLPPDSAALLLQPLMVSVTRLEASAAMVPYGVSVLDRRELTRGRPTVGLDEALVTVPGVFIANRYNPSQDQRVTIRGFGARTAFGVRGVKILLDGIPQTLPDGQGQLTNLELSDIDRVEVLRGASSALYGNASGGVISLRSTLGSVDRIDPDGLVVVGGDGLVKWKAGVAAPLGGGGLEIVGLRTVSDGYRQHSEADTRQLNLRLSHPVSSRLSFTVVGRFADSPQLQNPGALTREQFDRDPRQADPRNVAVNAGKAVRQAQVGTTLHYAAPAGSSLDVAVFGLVRDLENPLTFAFIDIMRRVYGGRAVANVPLRVGGRDHRVTFGVDAQLLRDDRINLSTDRTQTQLDQLERVSEVGPFVQAAVDVASPLLLTAGIRYDRVRFEAADRLIINGDDSGERVMSQFSWSAGVTYRFHPLISPYMSVGTSFETPTTTELTNRPDGAGGFNADLDPQAAVNVEFGLRGRAKAWVRYEIAAFVIDVRDELISFEVPSVPDRRFFRNAGSTSHRGVELSAVVAPLRPLQIVGAYTYAVHRFRDYETEEAALDGNDIPGVPRHQLHLSARIETAPGVWGAIDQTVTSGYFADDVNLTRNAAWVVVGLRVGWEGRLWGRRVQPYAGVLNLFEERYASSVVINAFGGRFFEPAPGRNAYVGFSVGR